MDAVVIRKKSEKTYNPIAKFISTTEKSNNYNITTNSKSSIKLKKAYQTKSFNFNCINQEQLEKRIKNKHEACLFLVNIKEINNKIIKDNQINKYGQINNQNTKENNKKNNTSAVKNVKNIVNLNKDVQMKIKSKNKISSVVRFLTKTLEEIIAINKENESTYAKDYLVQNKIELYCPEVPEISIIDYLKRIIKICKPELSTCILLSIYIDRFCENSSFLLTINNIHK